MFLSVKDPSDKPKRKADQNTIVVFVVPDINIPLDMVLLILFRPIMACVAE